MGVGAGGAMLHTVPGRGGAETRLYMPMSRFFACRLTPPLLYRRTMNTRTPHPLLAAGLALAAAALACIGGLPAAPQNDAASFATVTPGGRISVSLLTPTHPVLDVAVLDATPIGPVATGTAAAATAAVQTQTAPTLTPTVAGLLAPPAECPAPGSPRLPAEPPSFSQFDEAIAQYLS